MKNPFPWAYLDIGEIVDANGDVVLSLPADSDELGEFIVKACNQLADKLGLEGLEEPPA